ncbi:hypothetical protein Bca4012_062931 [Brassica carinata]|uniref:Uncharacterized protein n=1 Tax=Brassica carinata TaxID=52824 RepID=A0A8X7SCY8_BRACI|nr:hypothetical protein Bca52824_032554 [Brassica carinata]
MDLKPSLQNVIDDAAHPSNKNSSSSMSTHPTRHSRSSLDVKVLLVNGVTSACKQKLVQKSELSSTPPTVSDGNEGTRHQINVIDLELNPKRWPDVMSLLQRSLASRKMKMMVTLALLLLASLR